MLQAPGTAEQESPQAWQPCTDEQNRPIMMRLHRELTTTEHAAGTDVGDHITKCIQITSRLQDKDHAISHVSTTEDQVPANGIGESTSSNAAANVVGSSAPLQDDADASTLCVRATAGVARFAEFQISSIGEDGTESLDSGPYTLVWSSEGLPDVHVAIFLEGGSKKKK